MKIKALPLVLAFVLPSASSASSAKVDVEMQLIGDYKASQVCGFIGEKPYKTFILSFESEGLIPTVQALHNDSVSVTSGNNNYEFIVASIKDRNKLAMVFNDNQIANIADVSSKLRFYVSPKLIESQQLQFLYRLEILESALSSPNANKIEEVDIWGPELYQKINPYFEVRINKNDIEQLIEDCNHAQKKQMEERRASIEELTSHAVAGDVKSQIKLAMHYLSGSHVLKDNNKGIKWLANAANSGDPEAQYILGVLYATEEFGVLKDMKKAKSWIKKSHDNGHPQAQEMWNAYELWKY